MEHIGKNLYLHYIDKNYLYRSSRLNKLLRANGYAASPAGNAQMAMAQARNSILAQAKAKLQSVNNEILEQMSDVYSVFMFKNYNEKNEKELIEQYNQTIVNNFQEMFANSDFIKNRQLLSTGEGEIDYLKYRKKMEGILKEKDNTTFSVERVQYFVSQINSLLKDLERISGKNSVSWQNLNSLKIKIDTIANSLSTQKQTPGPNKGMWITNSQQAKELQIIMNEYNDLILKLRLSSTTTDQGDAGEVAIAAINYYINNFTKSQRLKLTKEAINSFASSINNSTNNKLKIIGKTEIPNESFEINNNFSRKFLSRTNKSFNVDTNAIDFKKSYSTADVIISWEDPKFPELKNIGASVKNYGKGLNTKSIKILTEANMLTVLNLTTTSFMYHFMNQTSILHNNYPEKINNHIDFSGVEGQNKYVNEKELINVLKYAALARGLSGVRYTNNNTKDGGEASIFILIDSAKKRVHFYNTLKIIELVFNNLERLSAIDLILNEHIKNDLPVIYENKYVIDYRTHGRSWYAAARRASDYINRVNKMTLSASIRPSLLNFSKKF